MPPYKWGRDRCATPFEKGGRRSTAIGGGFVCETNANPPYSLREARPLSGGYREGDSTCGAQIDSVCHRAIGTFPSNATPLLLCKRRA